MFSFAVKTTRTEEMLDITQDVKNLVAEHGGQHQLCIVYIPHTTAAVTINEHADPDVKRDILHGLNLIVPADAKYQHSEGNSPAHIKASLLGTSQTIMIQQGRLVLGTWQGIFLAEFDGPRNRTVYVKLL